MRGCMSKIGSSTTLFHLLSFLSCLSPASPDGLGDMQLYARVHKDNVFGCAMACVSILHLGKRQMR